MSMIPNELGFSDEEIAGFVADFCFDITVIKNHLSASVFLIEFLTLPKGCKGYTKDEMKKYILEEIGKKFWRDKE